MLPHVWQSRLVQDPLDYNVFITASIVDLVRNHGSSGQKWCCWIDYFHALAVHYDGDPAFGLLLQGYQW